MSTTPQDPSHTDDAAAPEPPVEGTAQPEPVVEAASTAEEASSPEPVTEAASNPEPDAAKAEPDTAPPAHAAAPAPAAKPAPTPGPKPKPRPGPPRPKPVSGQPSAPTVITPTVDPALEAAAATFGSVGPDGTVTVRDGDTERIVGQVADVPASEALDLYVRRYLDLAAQVSLLETRLPSLSAKDATSTLDSLSESLVEPAAVGDLPALRSRVEVLRGQAEELRAKAAAEREAAKAQAVVDRTAIVEQMEAIAATDPERIQWRDASASVTSLLDQWKAAQRGGVRIDRPTEDALWKRFSHARTSFDKARRAHFTALDRRNAEAKSVKLELVEKAEALATSTDWGPTARSFRDLMDAWRAAPRGSRKEDDALWTRFKAAQDTFFAARTAQNEAIDAEYQANLEVKEGLLEKAEALLPIKDIAATKKQLRVIQDAWDEAGKVPRSAMQQVEQRLRAVEQALRSAEQDELRRSDPELKARADGMAAQLLDSIAALEAELEAAKSAGDKSAADRAQAELDTKQQWLKAVQSSRG